MSFDINPATIYVYTRVSTRAQVHKTNGLQEQHLMCSQYINNHFKNYHVEYYEDVGSSYQDKNKLCGLNKILRKLGPNSLIVVRDVSRLGRNTFQVFSLLRKIKKTNSHIVSVSDNLCWNYSRLMDRQFSHHVIDAENDSDIKSNKNIEKNKLIVENGGYIGSAPYGTKIIKINKIPCIYKNLQEINVINFIHSKYKKLRNIENVTILLNKKNITNRKNSIWTKASVSNIIKKHYPDKNIFNNIPDIPDITDNLLYKLNKLPSMISHADTNTDIIDNINLSSNKKLKKRTIK